VPASERSLRTRVVDAAYSPITSSLVIAFVVVGVIILLSGSNPLSAYSEMWSGATSGSGPKTVVNRAVPIVGMALAISIPFRMGIINLGAEGQMVLGGLAAALTAIYMPGPGPLVIVTAFAAGSLTGIAWALLPALGQTKLRLPILITSLLLNVPAKALASYLVQYFFRDPSATSTATVPIPDNAHIPTPALLGEASLSSLLVVGVVVAVWLYNTRTVAGYESRVSGVNLRFSRYGGVDVDRQTIRSMVACGAIAGGVGAHLILGQAFRFVDNDLAGTGFAWTGLLVTLLAMHRAWPIMWAGVFFAALQVGGLAMQRSAGVSWQLAQVLQAMVILALALRIVLVKRRSAADEPEEPPGDRTLADSAATLTGAPTSHAPGANG